MGYIPSCCPADASAKGQRLERLERLERLDLVILVPLVQLKFIFDF